MLAALLAAYVFQDEPQKDALDAIQTSSELVQSGRYLPSVATLEKAFEAHKGEPDSFIGEFLAWEYSYVGLFDRAIELADGPTDPKAPLVAPAPGDLEGARREDAIRAIVRESKGRQVVILNEAHHVPRCRAFGLQLARALRREGFEYFAAETFTAKAAEAFAQGHPTREMGSYTIEPLFGDLVRQAAKLGYKPVHYETEKFVQTGDTYDRINSREIEEANNLVERLFKPHPKARVLIYCGYSHATEDWRKLSDGRELAWMAARLKKLTGIDPLTVDQTYELPHSRPDAETAEYRYADQSGWVKGPTVFRRKSGEWAVFGTGWKGKVDMQVFHPRGDGWLSMGGYRKPLAIPPSAVPTAGRALIQAFVATEPEDTIPMAQVLVPGGGPLPSLMLPKGEYRLVIQDESGASRSLGTIRQR